MDPVTLTVLVVAALGGVVAGGIRLSRWQQAKLTRAWTAAAEFVGGTYRPPWGPWWSKKADSVVVAAPGGELVLDHYTVSTGKSSAAFTRVRVPVPGAAGLGLKLGRSGFFGGLFGQDLAVDDPVFDERFRVRAKDAALAVAWLGAIDRVRLLAADPPAFGYTIDEHGQLAMVCSGLVTDVDALARAVHAALELAAGGTALLAAWRRVADGLGARLVVGAPTFEAARVRLELSEGGAPVAVSFAEGMTVVRLERPRREAAPAAPPLAAPAFSPAAVSDDGAVVSITWSGYAPDAARVGAAVAFARARAAVPTGYRA